MSCLVEKNRACGESDKLMDRKTVRMNRWSRVGKENLDDLLGAKLLCLLDLSETKVLALMQYL